MPKPIAAIPMQLLALRATIAVRFASLAKLASGCVEGDVAGCAVSPKAREFERDSIKFTRLHV